jgi:hypothetical protein
VRNRACRALNPKGLGTCGQCSCNTNQSYQKPKSAQLSARHASSSDAAAGGVCLTADLAARPRVKRNHALPRHAVLADRDFVSLMVSKFLEEFTEERNVETENRAEEI